MADSKITKKDRFLAGFCERCVVCRRARKKQKGLAYQFVSKVEGGVCPFCKAYEKVHGRKAHEPNSPENEKEDKKEEKEE